MKKVVAINLGGNAYQLDEEGLDVLSAYLEDARSRLHGNPDLDEIMADLELAVADKMNRFLGADKTVVSKAEIEQIAEEMGPVDSPPNEGVTQERAPDDAQGSEHARPKPAVRKLYKLASDDEKMIAGVCAGLAAYFGIDISIVRIVFVALTLATSGLALIGYLALMLIIPAAQTPQQQAAAYGTPFDARDVIDQAKSRLGSLGAGGRWQAQRHWNRHARKAGFSGIGAFLGLLALLLGIMIGLNLLIRVFQWAGHPLHLGPPFYGAAPSWLVLLTMIVCVYLLARIIGGGQRTRSSPLGALLLGAVQLFLILLLVWFAYRTLPFFRDILGPATIQTFGR